MEEWTPVIAVGALILVTVMVVIGHLEESPVPSDNPDDPPMPVTDMVLGRFLVRRILDAQWIHRRVEGVEFVGQHRARRKVSIDVDLADDSNGLQRNIVPLTYLSKGTVLTPNLLRSFDLRDGEGRCVSVVNRADGHQAAFAVLCRATEVLGRAATGLNTVERRFLWRIASQEPARAKAECGKLATLVGNNDRAVPAITAAWTRHPGLYPFLLRRFAHHYLLLAELPQSARGRCVLKLAYDIPIGDENKVISLFGVRPALYRFGKSVPLPCRSLHFEVQVPDQMELTYAAVRAVFHVTDPQGPVTRAQTSEDSQLNEYRTLAHLNLSEIPSLAVVDSFILARLRPGGGSWVVLVASILLTAALFLGAGAAESPSGQVEATATLLVVVPAVLAGVALRSEHDVVARLRGIFHILVMLLVLLSVIAAMSLVMVIGGEDPGCRSGRLLTSACEVVERREVALLRSVWGWLRWLSLLVTLLLLPFAVGFLTQRRPGTVLRRSIG